MDLLSIIQAIWRHKLAAIPVILLTAAGAFYVLAIKPPVYEASSSLLLLSPPPPPSASQISADPKLGKLNTNNPYANLGSLSAVADAVLNNLIAGSSQQALVREGADPRYKLALSTDFGNPPILDITGVGSSPQEAIRSANLVTEGAKARLYQMQKALGVNNRYVITATVLVQPRQAQLTVSGKLRTLIAVLGLGAILLFTVVSVIDVMDKRRKDASITARLSTRVPEDFPWRQPGTAAPTPPAANPPLRRAALGRSGDSPRPEPTRRPGPR